MSSLLNIGTSALAASQAALNTAGHNIANVNTPGYSRQSAVLSTKLGQFTGSGYLGKGVDVATVTRNYNDFQIRQVAVATALSSSDAIRYSNLQQLEQVFPTGPTGLGSGTNGLLNSFSDVAQSPSDLSARSVVLARAEELAARFRTASANLDEIQQSVGAQLKGDVASINSISTQIASVNQQIANATGSGQTPNDLYDLRDQLVRNLNKYIQTTTINAPDGTLTIMVAGSQPLVLSSLSTSLTLKPDAFDPARQVVYIRQSGQDVRLDENALGGGEVAGLLKFQNTDLQQAKDQLWKMALSVGDALNKQNKLGIDLKGAQGENFFNLITASASLNNGGTAVLDVSLDDAVLAASPSALVRSDYQVDFTGPNAGTIKRLSDNSVTAFTGVPVQIDGMKIQLTSGYTFAGDSFLIRQSTVAGTITSALTSPTGLAMANPVVATPAATNTGTLAIENLRATQANANLKNTVTLTFNGAGGFTVSGAVPAVSATIPYYPGQPINYNGWSLTLKGAPAIGDTMTVQANGSTIIVPGGATITGPLLSDAGNANAILDVRDAAAALFGSAPISDIYANILSDIGIAVQGGKTAADISKSLVTDAEQARSSISGVNLDEEAAKLIQYQQSYQASGKILQVSQTIFDTLLQMVR